MATPRSPWEFVIDDDLAMYGKQRGAFNGLFSTIAKQLHDNQPLDLRLEDIATANRLFREKLHPRAEADNFDFIQFLMKRFVGIDITDPHEYVLRNFSIRTRGYCSLEKRLNTKIIDTSDKSIDAGTELARYADPSRSFAALHNPKCATHPKIILEPRDTILIASLPLDLQKTNPYGIVSIAGGIKGSSGWFKAVDRMLFPYIAKKAGNLDSDVFEAYGISEDEMWEAKCRSVLDFSRSTILVDGKTEREGIQRCYDILETLQSWDKHLAIVFYVDRIRDRTSATYRDLKLSIALRKNVYRLHELKIRTVTMDEEEKASDAKHQRFEKQKIAERQRHEPLYSQVADVVASVMDPRGRMSSQFYDAHALGRTRYWPKK